MPLPYRRPEWVLERGGSKLEFRNIFISNPAKLSVSRGQLVIEQREQITLPLEDISSILIESPQVSISVCALTQISDNGITLFLCDEKHLPCATLLPFARHSRQLKMLKQQISLGKPLQKQLWQQIVTSKIANQGECLSLLDREGAVQLKTLSGAVRSGDPDNCEATAAAYYFPRLFSSEFTRDRDCLSNAALNYGYSILRGTVARNLAMYGFEPCLGLWHHSEVNQFNLADDLMEPYRPVVDLFVAGLHFSEDEESEGTLSPLQKHSLFHLTNHLVELNGARYRLISAIGQSVISLRQSMQHGTAQLLLPKLLPLEEYRFE